MSQSEELLPASPEGTFSGQEGPRIPREFREGSVPCVLPASVVAARPEQISRLPEVLARLGLHTYSETLWTGPPQHCQGPGQEHIWRQMTLSPSLPPAPVLSCLAACPCLRTPLLDVSNMGPLSRLQLPLLAVPRPESTLCCCFQEAGPGGASVLALEVGSELLGQGILGSSVPQQV